MLNKIQFGLAIIYFALLFINTETDGGPPSTSAKWEAGVRTLNPQCSKFTQPRRCLKRWGHRIIVQRRFKYEATTFPP